ncbi:hypothetical protein [Bacteroides sp.]|uniref:hypothetical protein n=1 Tax=Bacteroides sp. TaxID=29523 RepID=UPI0025C26F80|nr:hypothetical protein [Bacteroides sp.]
MTVKEFMILVDVIDNPDEVMGQINKLPKPDRIGKYVVPVSLDDISIGQLIELQSIVNIEELLFVPCRILFKLKDLEILKFPVEQLLGLYMWVMKEVERINKLFASTNISPTTEEIRAGIEKLSFGMFGLIDYYAIRMGITDHELVMSIPWTRVYKCMDIDAQKTRYERRLREVYQNKNK